jgi:pyruvyltransferase
MTRVRAGTSANDLPLYWWRGVGLRWRAKIDRFIRFRRTTIANFGDELSPAIVSRLSGRRVRHATGSGKLLAAGSVLFAVRDDDVVWGSGLLRKDDIEIVQKAKDIRFVAVRGPRTRKALLEHGLECPEVYGDPAILLPYMFPAAEKIPGRVGFAPHYTQQPWFKRNLKDPRVSLIDLESDWRTVLDRITSCEVMVTTSLHALIVAECYGIPSSLVVHRSPLAGDMTKFEDYYESTDRTARFTVCNDTVDIGALTDAAHRSERPRYQPEKLLEAFPYLRPEIRGLADLR